MTHFSGRVVVVGFGTIGQCALPLLLNRLKLPASAVTVVDRDSEADFRGGPETGEVAYHQMTLTPDTLDALTDLVGPGDLVANLSVGISSLDLAAWCQARGALYIDTAIEPWEGFVENASVPVAERTEYAFHQAAREAGAAWPEGSPTALFTHGANPGLVSHFAKAGLMDVAERMGLETPVPADRRGWAELAARTGTKVIHISERDTQIADYPKRPWEFVNTWSIDGFIEEAMMPVELGWGTHERRMPADAREHRSGPRNTIYLEVPAATYFLYSWVPGHGQILGLALPHSETITLSDLLTLTDESGTVTYRPTVGFVYLPCDDALTSLHEVLMSGWQMPERQRILTSEIVEGADELGTLLLGHGLGGWWHGSRLDIEQARRIVPHSNPTALQVAAGVVSGAMWVVRNPAEGFCEPEDLPFDEVLADARPYLGDVFGVGTDWTPLDSRGGLYSAPPAPDAPWQFANFRI